MTQLTRVAALLSALAACACLVAGELRAEQGAAASPAGTKKISVAVITGGHAFEKDPFLKVFQGHEDIESAHLPQKDGGEIFDDISKWSYDTIVLYNFNQKLTDARRENLLKLLDKGVGLFALHHAISGYTPNWPKYAEIIGGRYYPVDTLENGVKIRSGYKHGVRFKANVEDPNHPITKGVTDFEIVDETYCRYKVDPNVHVFLTTDEPTSEKAIGWVKSFGKARVCCVVLGHDSAAYANKDFIRLVTQAVRWTAGRLPEGNIEPNGATAATRPAAAKDAGKTDGGKPAVKTPAAQP